jgi:DNA polymerase I
LEGIGTSFDAYGTIEEDQDKSKGLRITPDGYNRAPLLPFTTKTSRNAPPGRAFLFSNSAWMRGLIQPRKGRAVAYLDWKAQELRIAAHRSGDPELIALSQRPDPYLELGIAAGRAPEGATKETHPAARKAGKILTLAMLYGAGPGVVMVGMGLERVYAVEMLRQQRNRFSVFYAWSDRFVHQCRCAAPLFSPLGWRWLPLHWKDDRPPVNTARNFPVQSTGADIMRLAAVRLFEARIRIAAIVHDAFLVEGSVRDIERITQVSIKIMEGAAETIVGAPIPVDCKITRHGEAYRDEDGEADFQLLMGMLEDIEQQRDIA